MNLEPVGNPNAYGYKNKVIARWCNPQYETYSTPTKIGVIAYHFSEIDRVEFRLNGEETIVVKDRSEHDGIVAYWFDLNIIPDKENNVLTAIVYPNHGTPFALIGDPDNLPVIPEAPTTPPEARTESFKWGPWRENGKSEYRFASDFGETLREKVVYIDSVNGNDENPGTEAAPKKTLHAGVLAARDVEGNVDGSILYLSEGDYVWGTVKNSNPTPKNRFRYLTVCPKPGIQGKPRITNSTNQGLRINKVKISGCLIQSAQPNVENKYNAIVQAGTPSETFGKPTILFENCELDGYDIKYRGQVWTNGFYGVNAVGCSFKNCYGALSSGLSKNCTIDGVHSDVGSGGSCVLNVRYRNHNRPAGSPAHPDVIQWYRDGSNTVIYKYLPMDPNEETGSQGIFSNPGGAWGIVNVAIDQMDIKIRGNVAQAFALSNGQNIIIRNSNIGGRWNSGFNVISSLDTGYNLLLQNVTKIRGNGAVEIPVLAQHLELYKTAGSPTDFFEVNVPAYFSPPKPTNEGGAKGVRYQFDWKDGPYVPQPEPPLPPITEPEPPVVPEPPVEPEPPTQPDPEPPFTHKPPINPDMTPDNALTFLVEILDKEPIWENNPNVKIACGMVGAKIIELQTKIENAIEELNK
jgi:hypothetical protein